MKKVIKAWFKKNQLNKDPNDFVAEVSVTGNLNISNILDELQKEGMEMNREIAIDLITKFNCKAAELAMTGNNVNTGLVNLQASIRGSFYRMKWNTTVNKVEVLITPSFDLSHAVAETTVEFLGEKPESSQNTYNHTVHSDIEMNDAQFRSRNNNETYTPHLNIAGEPACGIAFRTWLCKA